VDVPGTIPLEAGLALRLLSVSDAPAIYSAVIANREHLRVWLPWVDKTQAVEDTLAFLTDHTLRREQGNAVAYGLWSGSELLGVAGIHDISSLDHNAKIGYWLSKAAEGRGLMTLAVRALLDVCFGSLGLERVEILCAVGNNRSSAIPQRLGFRFEGVLRHAQWLNGRYADLRLFSRLKDEPPV
jgi:ribosomal-protein-serine acetyltransferase